MAYAADITYCTNNELGFDYLRDNMAIYKSELVQRGHAFAIVDEVDSILIDEARTPLIISGKGEDSSKLYEMADHFVSTLRKQVFAKTDEKEIHDDYDCDYIVDEKAAHRVPHRQRHRQGGEVLRRGKSGRRGERYPLSPHQSGHEGPRPYEAGH